MQSPTNYTDIFNFYTIPTPLCYTGAVVFSEVVEDLFDEGVFITAVHTDPSTPFFKKVQKHMSRDYPDFEVKLIILGIRYKEEYFA